MSSQQSRAF